MRFLVGTVLSLFAASTAFAEIDEGIFVRHMVAHKIGVEIICQEIIKEFAGLRRDYAMARCRAHDLSKVRQDPQFLEKYEVSKTRSIASRLGEIFGNHVPETQVDRGVIDEINRIDDAIAKEIDLKYQPTPAERRLADVFEQTADLTERGLHEKMFPPANGVYERSKPMTLASRYFAESPIERARWTAAERATMIRIANRIESDAAIKLKLIKSINHDAVERAAQPLEANSYFRAQRRKRADCFETLLRAPLPGA